MTTSDYTLLDRPEVSATLFHPRREAAQAIDGPGHSIDIPVADDHTIGARWHMGSDTGANILFFHGNGEIVADYDELGPLYNSLGINLLAVDYRGYGRSSGSPSVSAMMADCHRILAFCEDWLPRHNYTGPLILMGRSLGSASVLELAAIYPQRIQGLIIESGFAYAAPLLRLLGLDPDRIGFKEEKGFANLAKIRKYTGPTLIIHAEFDHIIPYSDSEALFAASPAEQKKHLKIPGANHNDIFLRGMAPYLEAVQAFCRDLLKSS
ncbi:MAG: alpha/beta fold hydrolase [Desulfobacterales bacterium]|jgi:pimeloyl-ACP methyl ester carboxylesterase